MKNHDVPQKHFQLSLASMFLGIGGLAALLGLLKWLGPLGGIVFGWLVGAWLIYCAFKMERESDGQPGRQQVNVFALGCSIILLFLPVIAVFVWIRWS